MNARSVQPGHGGTAPHWQRFLTHIHAQAQPGRGSSANYADTEPAPWPDTVPAGGSAAIPGLHVIEHGIDDAVTQRVLALLAEDRAPSLPQHKRKCPPCNGDCLQGDDCTATEWQLARALAKRHQAQVAERYSWLYWLACAAMFAAAVCVAHHYPTGPAQ
jgi:hypothetical protein